MQTTLDQFFQDFRIQNNQQPNETVLNRGLLRLKREIRELKSILDIIQGKKIEEWNRDKIYEIDEYVMYNDVIYRSIIDTNYGMDPVSSGFWQLQNFETIKQSNKLFQYQTIISEDQQTEFFVNFNLDSTPAVFVEGLLYDTTQFTYTKNSVILNEPLDNLRRVTIITGVSYESVPILPKRIITSLEDQYVFNTPFNLSNPTVFVDGLMKTSGFTYGLDYVEFEYPLSEGQEVVIINGMYGGIDLYSKSEIDDILDGYYLKTETYSKNEVDSNISKEKESILNDPSLAKSDDVYQKTEIDNKLAGLITSDDVQTLLDSKADKGTTLEHYGITDAYTKENVDELLKTKVSETDFNGDNIVKKLEGKSGINASSLDSLKAEQFLRSDVYAVKEDALIVQGSNTQMNMNPLNEIPEYGVTRNAYSFSSMYQPSFNGFNSQGLYFICEGEFKGTWWSYIYDFGLINPSDYNFIIKVHNIVNSNLEFIPKNYGNGYLFNKSNQSGDLYQYGFIDNNIVKLYSYLKTGETYNPLVAHYKIIAIKKTISTYVTRNQDDPKIEFLHFNGVPSFEFNQMVEDFEDLPTLEVPSIENDNAFVDGVYQSSKKPLTKLKYVLSNNQLTEDQNVQILVYNGLSSKAVNVSVEGDALVSNPEQFNQFGECFIEVTPVEPFEKPAKITISGDSFDNLVIEIPFTKVEESLDK